MLSTAINVLVGIVLLTMGRTLFWFFVGAAGFVLGNNLARQFLMDRPDWMILVVSLAAGLLGIVVALVAQKLAIALAGFAMGGYALISVLFFLGYTGTAGMWIGLLAGGVAGALLAFLLFNPALIALSSIAGATLIAQSVSLGPLLTAVLFIALVIIGAIIQTNQLTRKKRAVE